MRKRRRSKEPARWGVDGGGIALGIAGFIFLSVATRDFREWRTLSTLASGGESAAAKVTGTRTKLARNNIEIFSYEFKTEAGERFEGEDRFPIGGAYDAVPTLDRIKMRSYKLKVRYRASDPSVNRLDVALEPRSNRMRAWFFGLFAVSLGCFGCAVWRCRR